jgi:hypothetical protein
VPVWLLRASSEQRSRMPRQEWCSCKSSGLRSRRRSLMRHPLRSISRLSPRCYPLEGGKP